MERATVRASDAGGGAPTPGISVEGDPAFKLHDQTVLPHVTVSGAWVEVWLGFDMLRMTKQAAEWLCASLETALKEGDE